MGLDQYAYSREAVGTADYQWRKHPNLQGWMERLWRQKFDLRPDEGDFCCELELFKSDIIKLMADIQAGNLPATEGFFFGDDADEYYRKQDMEFCDWALNEIENGREVYYDSSW
jgi:hypothetical protein